MDVPYVSVAVTPCTGIPPSVGRVESQQIYFTCRQILPRNDIDPFADTPPF